jgi:ATP-dependent DNA helicase RecG
MIEAKNLKRIILQGEGLSVEFKKCRGGMPDNIYDTVCAFLNTKGGDILLGVADNGKIIGIDKPLADELKQNFANTVNNPSKLSPTFCISLDEVNIDGKLILRAFVPESSQVHRCNNRIFIRNNSGDFDITDKQHEITGLYIKKQTSYSENKIFPAVKLKDFHSDTIESAKKIASAYWRDEEWLKASDFDFLKRLSLYQSDPISGQKGFTLAGCLLFGSKELIACVAPAFKIDMIKRVENADRYDDRLDLRTNLVEAYEQAMAFIAKHLPDPFYLDGAQRISLRDNIFREVIANMIIHKEYLRPEPSRFIIERNRILVENSNRPHINGIITLDNSIPFPKNPNIAKAFRLLGRAEELGSGIRNIYKFCKSYCGSDPQLVDDNALFKFILPVNFFQPDASQDTPHDTQHDTLQDTPHDNRESLILSFCKTPKTREEIQAHIKVSDRSYFSVYVLNPLIVEKKLLRTLPDKPRSKYQKYIVKGYKNDTNE